MFLGGISESPWIPLKRPVRSNMLYLRSRITQRVSKAEAVTFCHRCSIISVLGLPVPEAHEIIAITVTILRNSPLNTSQTTNSFRFLEPRQNLSQGSTRPYVVFSCQVKGHNWLLGFNGIKCWEEWHEHCKILKKWCPRWWFQIFCIFTPSWGRFPFLLIFFRWVETTNQCQMFFFTWNCCFSVFYCLL